MCRLPFAAGKKERKTSRRGKNCVKRNRKRFCLAGFLHGKTNEREWGSIGSRTHQPFCSSLYYFIILPRRAACQQHSQYAQTVFFGVAGKKRLEHKVTQAKPKKSFFLCPKSFSSPLCWRIKSTSLAVERRLVSHWSLFRRTLRFSRSLTCC